MSLGEPLNILFLSDNFLPETNAPATRTFEHCRRWVERGATVTVITCAPNFPTGQVFEGYKNRLIQSEVIDGIKVIRVWSYMAPNQGFLKRTLDYLSFAFMAGLVGLFRKCDVIVATSPQFFTTVAASVLAKLKRKPWVFELRDLWPESILAVGAMEPGWIISLLEKLEIRLYRSADLIVPVSPAFCEHLAEKGIDEDKIRVITNGVVLAMYSPREADPELVTKLGLNGKFVVAYIGTHGMAHGLDFIVDCAAASKNRDIHFLFVGAGARKSALLERASELKAGNLIFLDPAPKDQVARYLALADVVLIPLRRLEAFRKVIPSKIFESAAMEVPILLGVDGVARDIVESYGAGLYYEPENRAEFQQQLQRLATDKELRAEFKIGCRTLAAAFDRTKLADDMLCSLYELCGGLSN